jgi:hypothetical protein
MILVTCNGTAKVWRTSNGIISIFTCQILETLRSIVLAITQKKLSKKFLVYEAEWNDVKINSNGKCILHAYFLSQLLIPDLCYRFEIT